MSFGVTGIEEAVHTMKPGGFRRVAMPASLGYNDNRGPFGPVPQEASVRRALAKALEELEESGELVFDLALLGCYDDEADPGYYSDSDFSQDVMEQVDKRLELMRELQGKAEGR